MRQEYEKASLAGGEISPALSAATDLRSYQIGLAAQENMVTVLEGIATRRPGTRFVLEAKDHSQRGKLWPFRYASGDYYMLAFNAGVMRVIRDAGYVVSGTLPFEVAIPWNEAQLASLRAAPLNNVLTFTVAGGRIRKITRVAADNWTVEEYLPLNGPVEAQNLDKSKTVLPDATSGAVSLLGDGNPFDAGMVGGVMRIDEANAQLTPLWTAGETILQPSASLLPATSQFGDLAGLANLVDGNPATAASLAGAQSCYAGFHFSSPTALEAIEISARNTGGLTTQPQTLRVEAWASTGAAPASSQAGVLLGAKTILDQDNLVDGLFVYVGDTETLYSNIWFRIIAPAGATNFWVAEANAFKRVLPIAQVVLRRWADNVYEAVSDGEAGSSPPVHDDGDASYGGVTWRFRCKTFGFVRIASVADANHAAGAVTLRLPDSALVRASYRWSPPSWSDGAGWPEIVLQNRQKFLFFRKNRLWATRPATRDDFLFTADSDSAIADSLTPPDEHSLPEIKWAASAGIVVLGTADVEWMLRAPGSNDVLQAQTIDPEPDSNEGSRAQIPCKVDRGVIFVDGTGKRLLYLKFDALTQQLAPEEISAAARHIFGAGVVATAWQKDPHKVLWIVLADGTLAAMTFMPAQKIIACHRHPMVNGFVEDIAFLPALDDGTTEIYLWVRRSINGQPRRYIELLQPFFPIEARTDSAAGAWYLDCALHYHGAPETRVTGLAHLEGQAVGVFADGAEQKAKIVSAGAVVLDRAASDVVVGLPVTWRIKDLPRSLQMPVGSSRGKSQRVTHMVLDVLNAAGGESRVVFPAQDPNDGDDEGEFEPLTESGASDYGSLKLYTGQIAVTVGSGSAPLAAVELVGDNALPFTLRAIVPDVLTEGD